MLTALFVQKQLKMSKVQKLRSLLKQRLPADDEEEIFELFERTIAEYEEELCGLKEENERQRKLLDAVFKRDESFYEADEQQLLVKEEIPSEQQEWICSLDQQDQKFQHIKEEEEELWTSEEQQRLQVLKVDINKFPFTIVSVKCADDDDDVKPQSSWLHQSQSEENREVDMPASSSTVQKETEAGREHWGGSESPSKMDKGSYLQPHTDDTSSHSSETDNGDVDWTEPIEPKPGSLKNKKIPVCDRSSSGLKPFCYESDQKIGRKGNLVRHKRIHTREKPFSCSECGKTFSRNSHLKTHMITHTGEKPFNCSECGQSFGQNSNLKTHMIIHTGEKPFICSECGKSFSQNSHLKTHMIIHTGDKPFCCPECDKTFSQSSLLKTHMIIHTGEKSFSCSECGKIFSHNSHLKTHMRNHTGEKPFSCSVCGKTFGLKGNLKIHMISHTGEKPFHCSECGKTFGLKGNLKMHMISHTGEKPFSCSECGQRFVEKGGLKRHMRRHLL